jgi:hypothetical protein
MPTDEDLDAAIKAGAQMLGLTVDPAWLPSVRANLDVTLVHARRVMAHPVPDEAEPAFVFGA